ncbi:MAG: cytidylate kinase family protein [Patescibacteria group bacterium]
MIKKNKNFIITISGTPGSGKSTIAQGLREKLKAKRIYVGGIRRKIAEEKNMTLAELNQYAMSHPETDVDVDKAASKEARQLARNHPVIVEGRTQYHFLPESIKIFVVVDIKIGAKRIWESIQNENQQQRNEAKVNNYKELEQKVIERSKSDFKRFKKYYNIDYTDQKQYDFVIDTGHISAQEATQKVLDFIKNQLKT